MCLVLECDLIVARGKEEEGREGERKRVCLYVLYVCLHVCVRVRVGVCVSGCVLRRVKLPVLRLPMLRLPMLRAAPEGFHLRHLQTIFSASPGLPAGTNVC